MQKKLRELYSGKRSSELEKYFRENGPLEIAGLFKREIAPAEYAQFLRQRFRHHPFRCAPLLKIIAKLPVRIIFTTNYDKLLETTCRDVSTTEDPIVIVRAQQLSGLNGDELQIVKLHGDIDHPDSIILTDKDYAGFPAKCLAMRDLFQSHIAFSTMVLIGFGLKDPNFSAIFAGARALLPDSAPSIVALMAKQNEFHVEKWRADGLTINNFNEYDEVPEFLKQVIRWSK